MTAKKTGPKIAAIKSAARPDAFVGPTYYDKIRKGHMILTSEGTIPAYVPVPSVRVEV